MIDWKEKYIGAMICVILLSIILIPIALGFSVQRENQIKEINDKDEKIWQLEVEVEDLKEQIHILENIEKVK